MTTAPVIHVVQQHAVMADIVTDVTIDNDYPKITPDQQNPALDVSSWMGC